jgi:hypothetical protein
MARICSIHQPSYWPYLGLFDKVARSDVFVFLDDVQYVKNDFKNRNRVFINSPASSDPRRVDWLTLPVRHVALSQTIAESTVPNARAIMRKHWNTVCQAYSMAGGFQQVKVKLEMLFNAHAREPLALADINIETTHFGFDVLGIKTEIAPRSSSMGDKSSDPTQRLIDICKRVEADTYLAGAGGRDYMRIEEFERQGIQLIWQDWKPFSYPQKHSPEEFVPHLSSLDFFLNRGSESATFLSSSGG